MFKRSTVARTEVIPMLIKIMIVLASLLCPTYKVDRIEEWWI